MEPELGGPKCAEHLEGDIGFVACGGHVITEPWAFESLAAERIGPRPDEVVPVADSEAQMILHPLDHHQFIRIVMPIGQDAIAILAVEGDRGLKLK